MVVYGFVRINNKKTKACPTAFQGGHEGRSSGYHPCSICRDKALDLPPKYIDEGIPLLFLYPFLWLFQHESFSELWTVNLINLYQHKIKTGVKHWGENLKDPDRKQPPLASCTPAPQLSPDKLYGTETINGSSGLLSDRFNHAMVTQEEATSFLKGALVIVAGRILFRAEEILYQALL